MSAAHPPVDVKRAVIRRDGGFCLLALHRCQGEATTTDHRANRGMGGSRLLNDPVNLIAACGICNGDKADATSLELEERGLWVRPAATHEKTLVRARETPVEALDGTRWFLLSATERITVAEAMGAR
jgi:5-methylcytosine-specific restriction endonuclease McrA